AASKRKRRTRGHGLEEWEVSLVKAMLATKRWSKQDIHAHFSHPERPINQARISQIASGKMYATVATATDGQLTAFLENYHDRATAYKSFIERDPLHPIAAAQILRVKSGKPPVIDLGENEWTEFKEAFNWNSRAAYARTMAGFANNRGGYLLFGVKDASKEIVGLKSKNFASFDPAKGAIYLGEHLAPSLRWDMRVLTLGGVEVGAIYVWPAAEKPVVCLKNYDELKAAEIYFRYVGSSSRIMYPELMQMLAERDRRVEQKWMQAVRRIQRIGVDNAAILDPRTGKVAGPAGTFLIDERLVPKLNFIREGQFTETEGAPTLRLIGQLEPVRPVIDDALARTEHVSINERELIEAFLEERAVPDPGAYIRQLCHVQPLWLPVYYYILLSAKTVVDALDLLKLEPTSYPARRKRQCERLAKGQAPPRTSSATNKGARDRLLAKEKFDVEKAVDATAFLKGLRTLSAEELDRDLVMPLMRQCFTRYHGVNAELTSEIRYAAAHLDHELFRPSAAGTKAESAPSAASSTPTAALSG
ncbi:MAG TPA: ATP-binding protein, partial [Stellaceae bacterium]|nr:ATP-binding protein [Stellaceae bacterium]